MRSWALTLSMPCSRAKYSNWEPTGIRGYRPRSEGMYPISRRVVKLSGVPFHETVPESADMTPSMMRIAVVLPAPLDPTNPKISPGFTWKLRLSRALRLPNDLLSSSMRSIGSSLFGEIVISQYQTDLAARDGRPGEVSPPRSQLTCSWSASERGHVRRVPATVVSRCVVRGSTSPPPIAQSTR